jgi:putative ABC transport system permease protein
MTAVPPAPPGPASASAAAPPRLAHWLLRRALPPDRCETVTGDLDELFLLDKLPRLGRRGARRWFWGQTASIVSARVLRRRTAPPPSLLAPPRKGDRMHGLRHDIRYAIRALLKTPGFTFIAVLTLALGIGGSAAIFTLVQALLLKPLPFADPGRLMMVHIAYPDPHAGRGVYRELVWSFPKYQQVFKVDQHTFQDSALFRSSDWNLTGDGDPERLRGEVIDGRYLSVLGVAPQVGRDIRPEEDRAPGVAPIVLLSNALWQRRFGGDPNIIGRTISLNAIPHTIVGILPAGFRGLTGEAQLWVPLMSTIEPGPRSDISNPWAHSYFLVARRKAGISVAQAQSEVVVMGARLNVAFPPPAIFSGGQGFGAYAVPLDDSRVDPLMRRAVFVLLGAVGAVLLIGCVNLANLLLTRALGRQREVAVRLAIGATRGRIVRQFLTESLLIAIAGACAGLIVAFAAMKLAAFLMPEATIVLPRQGFLLTRVGVSMIGVDMTTVMFTLGLAGLTALLFGLMPAWQASRSDVAHAIKAGGAGSIGRGSRGPGLRNLLIVAETALALVLLVAAGLMLTSVRNLQATGLGFQPDGLILSSIALPEKRYDQAHSTQFYTRVLEELRAQPGVQAAAYGNCAPVSGGCNGTLATFPDRQLAPGTEPAVGVFWASPEYFQTLGIHLVKGRTFTDRDREGQPKVVVVNEAAARAFWPGEDPIGKHVRLGQGGFMDGNGGEVVGVVADVRYRTVETAVQPDAYIPLRQSPRSSGFLFIRSSLDTPAAASAIRSVLRTIDADLPVVNVKTMGSRFGEATWRTRLSADLLGLFAGLALLLAAIGLYGVMAQGVAQRTREIGVRMALGADRGTIFRLVMRRALVIGAIGVAAGVALSVASMPLLDALLYQVQPNDPLTIASLAFVLIAVTLLASYVPARRATRVDPLTSLRAE